MTACPNRPMSPLALAAALRANIEARGDVAVAVYETHIDFRPADGNIRGLVALMQEAFELTEPSAAALEEAVSLIGQSLRITAQLEAELTALRQKCALSRAARSDAVCDIVAAHAGRHGLFTAPTAEQMVDAMNEAFDAGAAYAMSTTKIVVDLRGDEPDRIVQGIADILGDRS